MNGWIDCGTIDGTIGFRRESRVERENERVHVELPEFNLH